MRQIGDCKIELEISVKDYAQFNDLISDIRAKFSNLISNIDSSIITREFFKWLPKDIL